MNRKRLLALGLTILLTFGDVLPALASSAPALDTVVAYSTGDSENEEESEEDQENQDEAGSSDTNLKNHEDESNEDEEDEASDTEDEQDSEDEEATEGDELEGSDEKEKSDLILEELPSNKVTSEDESLMEYSVTYGEGKTITKYAAIDEDMDSDEMLMAYFEHQLMRNGGSAVVYSSNYFDGYFEKESLEKAAYVDMKALATEIAAGEDKRSVISINAKSYLESYLGRSAEWTAEELVLTNITNDDWADQDTHVAIQQAISKKITPFFDSFKLKETTSAVKMDCPYEMYWAGLLSENRSGYSYTAYWNQNGALAKIELSEVTFDYAIQISEDYAVVTASDDQEMDSEGYRKCLYYPNTEKTGAAKTAAENALEFVMTAESNGYSDYETLTFYKESLRELSDYNHTAADNKNTPYGDPWQLIYLFDGDLSTKVVCEGYSKGFQYLCELTNFDSTDIYVYMVTGDLMNEAEFQTKIPGPHMWNIIHMDDGKNYIVDITNVVDDTLFISPYVAGKYVQGTADNYYKFAQGNGYLYYVYDAETCRMYSQEDLTISATPYNEPTDPDDPDIPDEEIPASGWKVSADGVLTIYTQDAMNAKAWSSQTFTSVVIKEGIVSIPSYAFNGNQNIESVTLPNIEIPDSVTDIKGWAFYKSQVLDDIKLPSSLKTIGKGAFEDCRRLSHITIPKTVTAIGEECFKECYSLKAVIFDNEKNQTTAITTIPKCTFMSCKSLVEMELPSTIKELGQQAFAECDSLEAIKIRNDSMTLYNEGSSSSDAIFANVPQVILVGNENSTAKTYANTRENVSFMTFAEYQNRDKELKLYTNVADRTRYPRDMKVTFETSLDSAEVYYTTDGSDPTVDSEKYTEPIAIPDSLILKVLAKADGKEDVALTISFAKHNLDPDFYLAHYFDYQPKNLQLQSGEDGIELTWNRVPDSSSYYIYRKIDEGEYEELEYYHSDGSQTVKYTDAFTNLVGARNVSYKVATTTHGLYSTITGAEGLYVGPCSKEKTIRLNAIADPILSDIEVIDNDITLTWEPVEKAASYSVYAVSDEERTLLAEGIEATTYVDSSTHVSGTTYKYIITANPKETYASYLPGCSEEIQVNYIGSFAAPSYTYEDGTFTLDWVAQSSATSYELWEKVGAAEYSKLSTCTTNRYTDTRTTSFNSTFYITIPGAYKNIEYIAGQSEELTANLQIHTLNFDVNGGEGEAASKYVLNGMTYGALPEVVKFGCSLNGWYDSEKKIQADDEIQLTQDTTLKAIWDYKYQVETPICNKENETELAVGTRIALNTETTDASIYYTLDGTKPTMDEEHLYVDTILLTEDMVRKKTVDGEEVRTLKIRAIAVKDAFADSDELVCNFTVKDDAKDWGDIAEADRAGFADDANAVPRSLWVPTIESCIYTGSAMVVPDLHVYWHKKLLTYGTDYVIKYKNNTKVGTASINVVGKGDYKASIIKSFQITPRSIGSIDGENLIYNDENLIAPDVAVVWNNRVHKQSTTVSYKLGNSYITLKKGIDYDLVYADEGGYKAPGKYVVQIVGKGNYTGTACFTETISNEQRPINKLSITRIAAQEADGTAIKPQVTIIDKGQDPAYQLKAGDDYEVSYINNVYPGTATAIITGKGAYIGSYRMNFKISAMNLSYVSVSKLQDQSYTGLETEQQEYTLTYPARNGQPAKVLTEDIDYAVSYERNIEVGRAYILFTGINKYTGTVKKSYNITKRSIEDATILDVGGQAYAEDSMPEIAYEKGGTKPVPTMIIAVGDDTKYLYEGEDYTLRYQNSTAHPTGVETAPTAVIQVVGKGNYKDTIDIPYKIVSGKMVDKTVAIKDVLYANKAGICKPVITVTDATGRKLISGTDYLPNITYKYVRDTQIEQIVSGTTKTVLRFENDLVDLDKDVIPLGCEIRAVISGAGDYAGTTSSTFKYVKAYISQATVSVKAQAYTGKPIELSKDDIKVTIGKQVLNKTDYEIIGYRNNVRTGRAQVTIQGKGIYGGTRVVNFSILNVAIMP